jgi:hypothetical protein
LEEGLEKGMNAQRQTLLRLLEWRFQLSEAEKIEYSQQIAQVPDLNLLTPID